MRKPNSTFLWMLTLSLFVPLAALADKPTLAIKDMTAAQRAEYLKKVDADRVALEGDPFKNTLAVTPDADNEKLLRDMVKADQAPKAPEIKNVSKIATDIESWEALKKLIPDVKFADPDRGSKDQSYASGVHLEGSIPDKCAALIGNGTELVAIYDGTQTIDSFTKRTVPFRGWNFKTSEAAQDCVDKFLKDRKDKKDSGYCKTDKFPQGEPCTLLSKVTAITNVAGGPKIGFYTCSNDSSDCSTKFWINGSDESSLKRVADSAIYDDALKKINKSNAARRTNLQLWKIKNVDQCYGYGKKKSLTDFFSDVADLKDKLKDKEDLSPYVKKGLNNEIARLRALAETGKTVSELPAFSSEVAAFYSKYLATSRSDVPNPDLDLMRRATLALFKTMERRVLDDDSALKNPGSARTNAEAIISQALTLAPDDINLKNELEAGIKVDTTVLALQRKQVAFLNLKRQCEQNPYSCDWVRLQAMERSVLKAQQQAAVYYQKLQISARKQCATGRKRSKDPFDDEGLIVDGSDDGDDEVTFTSRCEAANDNLNRVYRRLKESSEAAQSAAGPDPRIVTQLAQGINGANGLPNATILPGQNGYNPALAYALDPNRFPGNFSSDYLRRLVPTLEPSTALGTGQMCLTAVGQTSNCFGTGNQIVVNGAGMPPALPRI